jgi:hypothetical protein
MSSEYLTAKEVSENYRTCPRTLDRAGVPNYRLTPKGKKLYRKADIEAALTRNMSSTNSDREQLEEIVNRTVDEVLKGITQQ